MDIYRGHYNIHYFFISDALNTDLLTVILASDILVWEKFFTDKVQSQTDCISGVLTALDVLYPW